MNRLIYIAGLYTFWRLFCWGDPMTDTKTNLAVLRPEIVACVKSTIESAAGAVWYDQMSELSEDSTALMQEAIYNRVVDAIIVSLLGATSNG